MLRSWRLMIFGTVGVALIILMGLGLYIDPHFRQSIHLGKPMPAFSMPSLDDPAALVTNKDFQGQVFVVNFWASWCTYCAVEHPILLAMKLNYHVPILGVDYRDERQAAQAWLKKRSNPYQSVGFDVSGDVAIDWGVSGTPETFIVDKKGLIRFHHLGELTATIWQRDMLPVVNALSQE